MGNIRSGPAVCVVVLNWNGAEDTMECLESLIRQDYPDMTVVLCDNASQDTSLARILDWGRGHSRYEGGSFDAEPNRKSPGRVACAEFSRDEEGRAASPVSVHILQTGENRGFAAGNNVGIRYALEEIDAELIWLLNNDAVAEPSALTSLVEHADLHPDAGIIGSKILEYEHPAEVQAAGGGSFSGWTGMTRAVGAGSLDNGKPSGKVALDYVTGASLLVRSDVIRDVGMMDERYFLYSEEVDWCLRARRAGWKMQYAAKSRVRHRGGGSVGHRSPLHDFHATRGSLLLVRRFYPRRFPVALAYSVARCVVPKVVRWQPERLSAVLRAYADVTSAGASDTSR